MRQIKVEKVTINVGTGKDQKMLEKGLILIKHITGQDGIKTITNERIAVWGLRAGLPIGCKLTLRGEEAIKVLDRLLGAKDHILKESCFDNNGNISFGVHEYIDIPDIDYNPDIGIMGFQVSVTLNRPGFRVKKRRMNKAKVPITHKISKEESIAFAKENFKVTFGED